MFSIRLCINIQPYVSQFVVVQRHDECIIIHTEVPQLGLHVLKRLLLPLSIAFDKLRILGPHIIHKEVVIVILFVHIIRNLVSKIAVIAVNLIIAVIALIVIIAVIALIDDIAIIAVIAVAVMVVHIAVHIVVYIVVNIDTFYFINDYLLQTIEDIILTEFAKIILTEFDFTEFALIINKVKSTKKTTKMPRKFHCLEENCIAKKNKPYSNIHQHIQVVHPLIVDQKALCSGRNCQLCICTPNCKYSDKICACKFFDSVDFPKLWQISPK